MKKTLITILLFFLLTVPVFSQTKIFINEFLIDPQPQQVEVINTGADPADLSDWIIDDNGGSSGVFSVPKNTVIYPNSCLVFSKDFNFNKASSDSARLLNNNGELVDSFSYKSSSGSGISYQRVPDGESWTTGVANLGLFNSNNLSCVVIPTPTLPAEVLTEAGPTPTVESSPTPTPVIFENVFLSEVMVNSNPNGTEWIEIYNDNDFPVSLVNWFIDDDENSGSAPKIFSLEIPPYNYKIYYLSSSIFNNDGDSVRLLDSDKNVRGDFEYSFSVAGQTYGRISTDEDFCLQDPSFESVNNSCLNPVVVVNSSPSPTLPLSGQAVFPTNEATIQEQNIITPRSINRVIHKEKDNSEDDILGASTKKNFPNPLPTHLSFLSFGYSLLTLISIFFKMKFKYAKSKKILLPFFYSPRRQQL